MRLTIWACCVAALLLAAGCGGDSAENEKVGSTEGVEYPKGPTREFFVPGGDNAIQLFGREAPPAEREAASGTIQKWMRARAAGDWEEVCGSFSRGTADYAVRSATSLMQRPIRGCARSIGIVFAKTDRLQANTMTEPVTSLRIGGGRGYAQYHGRGGKDWIVPVRRENGEWKVDGFDPVDRLK